MTAATTLDSALEYVGYGWHVLPLHMCNGRGCSCGNPKCGSPGKHPRTEHGLKDATTDHKTIEWWWRRWPDANIGIATGQESGIVAVDIDPRHGGQVALEALQDTHGRLPDTIESVTGGGGRHLLFKHPGGRIKNSAGEIGNGIDVKSDGGYIVAPPSVHSSGRNYVWELSSEPGETPLADLPGWLLARLTAAPGNGESTNDEATIPEGQRNRKLASLAGSMRRGGMAEDEILPALRAVNMKRCQPPLDYAEVVKIAGSVSRYSPVKREQHNLTDIGNGERLVELHGGELRFCHPFNTWLIWDGRRWREDDTSEIRRRAKHTIKSVYADAAQADDDNYRKALAEHARRSESESRIRAMIELAKSEDGIPVLPDELDGDLWALNVANGTIDLRTGELRPHAQGDLITKLASVEYHPDAVSAVWDDFLADTTDADPELVGFLQRVVGYTLVGDPMEEILLLVHGPAASGKSTFIEAIKATLGDYAKTADFETFLANRNIGGPRNDIARLAGARLVASVEVDQGRRLAEGLVKMITGGDTVTARHLYKEGFEFRPSFTLWLCANHAPRVRSDDDAIWRRVLRIPFEQVVPKERRDPRIKQTLRDPAKAGSAILAWAVRGCLEWQRDGLQVPAMVQTATEAYRADQDPLRDFITDCCILDPNVWEESRELRKPYDRWCEQNGDTPVKSRTFSAQIRARGCEPSQRNGVRGWCGIVVKTESILSTG